MRNSKLWSGLTSLFAVVLVIALIGQSLALANASYINSALGVSTTKVVQTGESGDTTYFKSSFGDFDDPAAQLFHLPEEGGLPRPGGAGDADNSHGYLLYS